MTTLLCPIDFSDHSRRALRIARAIASSVNGRLIVLTVVDPLLAEAASVRLSVDLAKGETAPALAEFVKATWPGDASAAPPIGLDVRVGDPADEILAAAAEVRADMIVMGTQGLGGLRKLLLGSTTEHVLRRAQTPVLAVPLDDTGGSGGEGVPFARGPILAATDLSDLSGSALERAAALSRQFGVPLLIAHVVEPITLPPVWRSNVEAANQARLAGARARLTEIARRHPGVPGAEIVATMGSPAEGIAALAEERGAGVIVMGLTADHGPFGRRPGTIAYRVLCAAGVPVLIVPGA
jgi:universal stress protein A